MPDTALVDMQTGEIVSAATEISAATPETLQRNLNAINIINAIVQQHFEDKRDFMKIPGTGGKNTLLKSGCEKVIKLTGSRSSCEIVESTRDFEKGFFQYLIKCTIYDPFGNEIGSGLGTCNNKETKYKEQNAWSIDNTILKMAKKRALVDATLSAFCLSNSFTQDLEDIDIPIYTDQSGTITREHQKDLFAAAVDGKGIQHNDIVKKVMDRNGYVGQKSSAIKKMDFAKIYNEVVAEREKMEEEDRKTEESLKAFDALPDKLPEEPKEKVEEEKPIEPQEVQQQIGHHDPEFAGFDLDDIEF